MKHAYTELQQLKRKEADRELVDELVVLHKKLAPYKAEIKRYEEVKRLLRQRIVDDPDVPVTLVGKTGDAVFSRCRNETEVCNKKKLVRLLGRAEFDRLAQFPVAVLEQYLNRAQIESVTTKVPGSRSLIGVMEHDACNH